MSCFCRGWESTQGGSQAPSCQADAGSWLLLSALNLHKGNKQNQSLSSTPVMAEAAFRAKLLCPPPCKASLHSWGEGVGLGAADCGLRMLPQGRNQGERRACVPGPVLIPEHKTQAERGHIGGETYAGHQLPSQSTCVHTCTPGEASSGHCLRNGGAWYHCSAQHQVRVLNGLSLGVPFTSQSPSAWGEGGTWRPLSRFCSLCFF